MTPQDNKRRLLLAAALFLGTAGCAPMALAQTAADAPRASVAPGRWITLDELEKSLPPAPAVVGFDIDDTLIFPSPGFNIVLNGRDASGTNPYGADMRAVIANPKSREDLHTVHDAYALPKLMGRKLIELHKRRGDRIHFITARVGRWRAGHTCGASRQRHCLRQAAHQRQIW